MLQVVELLLNAGAETHVTPCDSQADELNITDIIEAGADFNYAASGLEVDNLNMTDQTAFFCGYIKQSY
ncbi:unnamed protein product [Rotaria sordida]|uniref:Uncharacterized protein n=1 Tax=Rotaria sordida TaxID=392033 RepID=A0A816DF76_9BILA|nr:unnamed protein product [Rotaria sordida]CAF1636559.1 unnamed protein product [Rotaria sordida]